MTASLHTLERYRTELLPRAGVVLKVAEARFEAGDSGLSEVLTVRSEWAAVHLAYLELLRDAMEHWLGLSAFSGAGGAP